MILETVQKLSFDKNQQDEWFIDLQDYPGNKEDLQMVAGADTLLDFYSGNGTHIDLYINTDGIAYGDTLKFIEPAKFEEREVGAWYMYNDQKDHIIWLCDVVHWLFGNFPPTIYIQKCLN